MVTMRVFSILIAVVCATETSAETRYRNLSIETVAGRRIHLSSGEIFDFCQNGILYYRNKSKIEKRQWSIGKNWGGQSYISETDEDGDTDQIFFLQMDKNTYFNYGSSHNTRLMKQLMITQYGAASCK